MSYICVPMVGTETANVATDKVGEINFPSVKLIDGAVGSTLPIVGKSSAPNSTDFGLLVRTIGGSQGGGSTAVDATLTSIGSTRLAGRVDVNNPTTLVTVSNPTTAVTVSNPTTAVDQGARGSSATPWWVRETNPSTAGGAGSTTVDANLTSAGSTKIIGLTDGIPFASGALTSANSSADVALLAANAARRAVVIQNASTGTELLIRLSTVAVSSASAYNFKIPANSYAVIGGQLGNIPLYTGAIRGKMNSTAVAGPVFVTEFT